MKNKRDRLFFTQPCAAGSPVVDRRAELKFSRGSFGASACGMEDKMPIFQTVAAACRAAGEKLRSWKQKKRTNRLWRVVLWGILWAMLCPTLGPVGHSGKSSFVGKGKHSLWGWKPQSRIKGRRHGPKTARLNQMPGIQTKTARLSQMPGTRIKTARLSQVPEAQTGQSSPMLPQRKQKPLWCTSAEQYPLRGL